MKADLTAKLQAAGVDATAYAAKLPGGQTSVVILNKDAEKDLVLSLEFGSGKSGKVEVRDAARAGARKPGGSHHALCRSRPSQGWQVLRHRRARIWSPTDRKLTGERSVGRMAAEIGL